MLTFFPEPYPDELFYSVLARYHLRSSNSSIKDTLRDLFNSDSVVATIDLPSHLNKLCSNLPLGSTLTSSEMLNKHTLYPLFAPFLPEDRAQKIKEMMLSENGNGIHMSSGVMASGIKVTKDLHFCPKCFDEDILRYGEPYWHRIHQVPGVFICPIHNTILNKMKLDSLNRHEFIPLPLKKPMSHSILDENEVSNKTRNLLYEFALEVKDFLSLNGKPNLYNSKKNYVHKLHENGYLTATSRIRQAKLHEQFLLFYGDKFLSLLSSSIDIENNWLSDIVRKPKKVHHPVRHLLLIKFLYGSFRENTNTESYRPFDDKPWPCLNKASKHYKENVVHHCKITRCSDTGRPVGTFICDCGFIYSRRGPDTNEQDRYKIGRIKQFGPIWFSKLKEKLKDKNLSYRKIAKELGVNANTVIKYEKKLRKGMEIKDTFTQSVENQTQKLTTKHRRSLINQTSIKSRVDWELRDLQLSYLVEVECKKILSSESKPIRITLTCIGKRIGALSLLEQKQQKLPVTISVLNQYKESIEQFQIRRVKWATEELSINNENIVRWKIEKKAGLRPGYSKLVSDEIENQILKHSSFSISTEMGGESQWLH